ncbi:MAG: M20/M25/M40 family metallo-hydrolase [Nannocystales bacterium]
MRVPALLAMLSLGVLACRTTPDGVRTESSDTAEASLSTSTASAPRAPSLDAALADITAARLREHVTWLAADSMRGRATPSIELDEAAKYLATTLANSGIEPGPSGDRMVTVACGPGGENAFNVLGMLPGATDEVVMVTAHYDHVGEASEGDDRVFNGANDNASGVAAMLAVAHALARAPAQPRRTLAFVAFCGEEHHFRGSAAFVADPPFPLSQVVAMFNLEMLGHPDPTDAKRAWVTGHAYSSLHDWLDRGGEPGGVTFVSGKAIGPAEGNAFERSDNLPFAQHGVVAHTIAAGPLDEHYHAVSDETSRVDFDAMVPIVRSIARAVDELARGETSPGWTNEAPERFTRRASSTSRQ